MGQDLVIPEQEKYNYLIEEARAIISQRVKNSRVELITGYGELGELIYNNPLYQKNSKGNSVFVKKLFSDIGIGESTGYYAIQFYEKYIHNKFADVSKCLERTFSKEGDNLSWNKLITKYLPESHKEPKHIIKKELIGYTHNDWDIRWDIRTDRVIASQTRTISQNKDEHCDTRVKITIEEIKDI